MIETEKERTNLNANYLVEESKKWIKYPPINLLTQHADIAIPYLMFYRYIEYNLI